MTSSEACGTDQLRRSGTGWSVLELKRCIKECGGIRFGAEGNPNSLIRFGNSWEVKRPRLSKTVLAHFRREPRMPEVLC